jgi:bifunctional DNA primase/polymerase-like protein
MASAELNILKNPENSTNKRPPSTGATNPNASQLNTRLDWALKYSGLGFCVIPAYYRSKNAAIEWKSYQNRMSTEEEIRRWFTNTDYNVAIVLGRVSCALEIDIDGQGGKKRFEVICE